MVTDAIETTSELPAAYGPEVTVRFLLEYSSRHPLWFWFDYPDLADLQLPLHLADRLQRWSGYWDSTFHWDDGWPTGTPETWWTEEQARLPRDVAIALGSDFVIEVDGRYLHSTSSPGSLASAAALHALIAAETAERHQIRANIAAGANYDAVAGKTSYRAWLADRQSEEPPTQ